MPFTSLQVFINIYQIPSESSFPKAEQAQGCSAFPHGSFSRPQIIIFVAFCWASSEIDKDLNNTLLYVYRDLSDPELEEFATFAESPEGKAYYQAALAAIRAGLAVGQSTSSLTP